MIQHNEISVELLRRKIKNKEIHFSGNKKLKIYGLLTCSSGKKTKTENRVFFKGEVEALANDYRPCAHCMKAKYKIWKHGFIQSNNR
ncbi:MAG: metal-binding protein [Bacteroidetes bacterium]|nr:metal-binding protein [Bacteroidota bacterium]MBS1558445.1 metal-binding protein [Bacteroidota bacterium]